MANNKAPLKIRLERMDVKKKILMIIFIMLIIRTGSVIPIPVVNRDFMKKLLGSNGLGFLNSITGGSLYQMSIFALSISPYITASIIIQLLSVVIPALEEMKKDGKTGQEKLKRITNICGVGMALLQASAMAIGLGQQGLLYEYNALTVVATTAIWTIGALVLIAFGELISLMNIGSGISMILFCNIVASIPSDVNVVKTILLSEETTAGKCVKGAIILAVVFCIILSCVVMNLTVKKIKIQQTRKISGGSAESFFPIPLNVCSVMPVIFSGTIMSIVLMISRFIPAMSEGIIGKFINSLSFSTWFNLEHPKYTIGAIVYILLSMLFGYFYLSIGFNAAEIANNFKTSGMIIPGIRPGAPTREYIKKHSKAVAMAGNAMLIALILIMHLICNVTNIGSISVAGTSIVILVSVVIEEYRIKTTFDKAKSYKYTNGILGA